MTVHDLVKMQTKVFAVIVLLMLASAASIYAQCGGRVMYIVRDKSGRILDPNRLDSIEVDNGGGFDNSLEHEIIENMNAKPRLVKTLHRTCLSGGGSFQFKLTLHGKVMVLKFLNVSVHATALVNSLPFRQGTYEIDLHGMHVDDLKREEHIFRCNNYDHTTGNINSPPLLDCSYPVVASKEWKLANSSPLVSGVNWQKVYRHTN